MDKNVSIFQKYNVILGKLMSYKRNKTLRCGENKRLCGGKSRIAPSLIIFPWQLCSLWLNLLSVEHLVFTISFAIISAAEVKMYCVCFSGDVYVCKYTVFMLIWNWTVLYVIHDTWQKRCRKFQARKLWIKWKATVIIGVCYVITMSLLNGALNALQNT